MILIAKQVSSFPDSPCVASTNVLSGLIFVEMHSEKQRCCLDFRDAPSLGVPRGFIGFTVPSYQAELRVNKVN